MIFFRFALLLPCLLSLAACACPRTDDYKGGEPYTHEGTSGSGMIDEGCFRRALNIPKYR